MAVEKLGIVGSGIMGSGVAEVAARAGLTVVLRSRKQETADALVAGLGRSLAKQVQRGKLDEAEAAAVAHEPHRIAFYLYDLASEFHALWTKGRDLPYLRFIMTNDAEITRARLAMVQGVVSVLASGLAVLGVHAPTEMR